MAGLLGTLNTAKSGMNVSQVAIQTTSHNISNINTPGYSRQRVEQSASRPYSQPGRNSSFGTGQIGTGAQISDVTRIRNSFYDYQFRSESHSYGDTSVKYDYYKNIEGIFNEPSDSAISSSLNNFFNSWNELSKDPSSAGTKNVVIENAKYLANNINNVYGKLENLEDNLKSQQESILKEINSMLSEIKELDKNIKVIQGLGKSPNDLMDERDRLLDDLSFKLNISDSDVQGILKGAIENDKEVTLEDLKNLGDGKVSGELQGTITMEKDIAKYKESLEKLSENIVKTVNEVYKNGNPDKPDIFVVDKENGKLIAVNSEIEKNVDNLEITADEALALYNLKSKKINIDGKEVTINTFYNNMIQEAGQASASVIRDESNQSKLLSNIDSSRSSVSGVALDEEMISLVQLQHAYNANAKVLSTIDSLLDVVVNGLIK